MAKLTSEERRKLPVGKFAIPSTRSYPIEDASHARNALARVSGNGTAIEKEMVRAEVARRFPAIGKKKK